MDLSPSAVMAICQNLIPYWWEREIFYERMLILGRVIEILVASRETWPGKRLERSLSLFHSKWEILMQMVHPYSEIEETALAACLAAWLEGNLV